MCGRITLTVEAQEIAAWLRAAIGAVFPPRYNIAPTQWVTVARYDAETQCQQIVPLRWGLVPPWATELSIGNKMINARSEGVFEKRSFRGAMRKRRCVIPASGFYEWKRGSRERLPFLFQLKTGRPFALAGLWERNDIVPEGPVETFTILTTSANPLISPLHDRMPVILPDAAIERWLDPAVEDARDLLLPLPESEMTARPVSTFVNNPAHEGPACIAPAEAPAAIEAPPLKRKKSRDAPGQAMLFDQ